MISSGGLTARLRRLERAGYICRLPDPDDARSTLVQLTPEGQMVAERAFREDMAFENSVLEALDPEEITALEAILRKLVIARENANVSPVDGCPPESW